MSAVTGRRVRRRLSGPSFSTANGASSSQAVGFVRMSGRRRFIGGVVPSGISPLYNGYEIPSASELLDAPSSCLSCGALLFQFEPKGFCCLSGKIKLVSAETPRALHTLFTGLSSDSIHFRKFIRAYNNAFAFTSMGVRRDTNLMQDNAGIYVFRVQGQIYHNITSLIHAESQPSHLQMYFLDTADEIGTRMGTSGYLLPQIMALLSEIMLHNPYATFFRSLRSLPDLHDCNIALALEPQLDQRVYNSPTASEVAAIWVEGGNLGDNFDRSIILEGLDNKVYPIYHNYGCYDALQYPLLFPRGDIGWHPSIQQNETGPRLVIKDNETIDSFLARQRAALQVKSKRNRVSCRDYYCYKLQIRAGAWNSLLIAGRLLQQFVVDVYIKIETGRLQYIRQNQKTLRADLYQGIVDSVLLGNVAGSSVGKRVVLPASFIGGPRDMRRRYLDAMALVRQFGKPDIFLTMTCNPGWPEITTQLLDFELAQNRPDLVSRVFRAKLESLKNCIVDKAFFGPVAAYVYVVEFQKRGLPHAHFLIILHRQNRIRTAAQVDSFVSAELPDIDQHPRLHALVVSHMMHGPCGPLNPRNVCMNKRGCCKHKFPRDFVDKTHFGDDSFPKYRRLRNDRTTLVRSAHLGNAWVVPYNPLLLANFNCHLNVEICSSIKAVKYLYKYIYKGHDRVKFTVTQDEPPLYVDEVSLFQEGRWISPPEAAWRIFAFPLNEMYPHVYTLQVHLPGFHQVHFHQTSNLNNILLLPTSHRMMLTEYFALNRIDDLAKKLFYKQLPEHYVWDKGNKVWEKRKNKLVIGRMVSVNLAEGERYFLRLLLSHVRGATSFENLRTVGSTTCQTYREACALSGLLHDDDHHITCFEEALGYAMPFQLRQLFVVVLAYGALCNPRSLWEKYKTEMLADFVANGKPFLEAEMLGLQQMQGSLDAIGKDIHDFYLVDFNFEIGTPFDFPFVGNFEDQRSSLQHDCTLINQLNEEQRSIYDMVIHAIQTRQSLCVFVDGPGGTGKTFLYKAMLAYAKLNHQLAFPVASSGVAASLLPGGRTAHNRFKIPLAVQEHMQCSIAKQSVVAGFLKKAQLFIWDEAPMLHRFCFESVDRLLRDLTDVDLPFGGKVFVLGGDFRQVLPVLPRGSKEDICNATIVASYLWPVIVKKQLTHNMRAGSDQQYADFLMQVGNGEFCSEPSDSLEIPAHLMVSDVDTGLALQSLIFSVFPDVFNWNSSFETYKNRVLLTPKNDTVDELNMVLLQLLPGDSKRYYSYDEPLQSTERTFEVDFLNTLSPPGLPLHELCLKENCPLILLRNLSAADGLCNGTRLTAKRFLPNLIEAVISTGDRAGVTVLIPRIIFEPAESQENAFSFKRTQFPVKLCFAMTLNKAQGQTLDFVGLYLKEHVFAHGQLYVGLSRVRDSNSIKIQICSEDDTLPQHHTRNIVYKHLLDKR